MTAVMLAATEYVNEHNEPGSARLGAGRSPLGQTSSAADSAQSPGLAELA
jgi:hypothetical protein